MTQRIPIAGPWITQHEVTAVADAAANGWYGNAQLAVRDFEQKFAAYIGVKHAAAVPHCTSALHLAAAALRLGPGDEVIVPETTWIASAAPFAQSGATIVFADIDPETWTMSPDSVAAAVTPRTRAIVPVGLYGLTPDFDALGAIAQQHGLTVVEDAAQTLGSRYKDRLAGIWGEISVFSFHGTKLVSTGEGGMLVTDSDEIFERVALLRDHGRTKENFKDFYNTELGYKYRMNSITAALGAAQLSRIDELIEKKRRIFGWYRERLDPSLTLNAEPNGYFNTYWMTTLVLPSGLGKNAKDVIDLLDTRGIDTRRFFHPLSALPAFADNPNSIGARQRNPVAYELATRALNLPSALALTEEDVSRVCRAVHDAVGV